MVTQADQSGLRAAKRGSQCTPGPLNLTPFLRLQFLHRGSELAWLVALAAMHAPGTDGNPSKDVGIALTLKAAEDWEKFVWDAMPDHLDMRGACSRLLLLQIMTAHELSDDLRELLPLLDRLKFSVDLRKWLGLPVANDQITLVAQRVISSFSRAQKEWGPAISLAVSDEGARYTRQKVEADLAAWLARLPEAFRACSCGNHHTHGHGHGHDHNHHDDEDATPVPPRVDPAEDKTKLYRCSYCHSPSALLRKCAGCAQTRISGSWQTFRHVVPSGRSMASWTPSTPPGHEARIRRDAGPPNQGHHRQLRVLLVHPVVAPTRVSTQSRLPRRLGDPRHTTLSPRVVGGLMGAGISHPGSSCPGIVPVLRYQHRLRKTAASLRPGAYSHDGFHAPLLADLWCVCSACPATGETTTSVVSLACWRRTHPTGLPRDYDDIRFGDIPADYAQQHAQQQRRCRRHCCLFPVTVVPRAGRMWGHGAENEAQRGIGMVELVEYQRMPTWMRSSPPRCGHLDWLALDPGVLDSWRMRSSNKYRIRVVDSDFYRRTYFCDGPSRSTFRGLRAVLLQPRTGSHVRSRDISVTWIFGSIWDPAFERDQLLVSVVIVVQLQYCKQCRDE
uniref:Uncharacterized protein n=1 Tax=Mycena chlorophos TaxID=658473 RepID=A0ABQ0LT69_MYCCL|nr:predicted protein [Mycena chlorophos]